MTGTRPLTNIPYAAIADARRGARSRHVDVACPRCGPEHTGASARRKVLRTWTLGGDRISLHCARCGLEGWIAPDWGTLERVKEVLEQRPVLPGSDDERDRARKLELAAQIWRESFPIAGTAGEAFHARRGI